MDITASTAEVQKHVAIFCCYARKDQPLLQELKNHLMPLKREGMITLWADTDINAGAEWEKEIHLHLNTSDIILLLVSPNFMASDYCYSTEMTRAMERHKRGEAQVIPIILRPVDWKNAPFAKFQALPQDAHPIISSKWAYRDEGFTDAARGIREAVKAHLAEKNSPSPLVRRPDQEDGDIASTQLANLSASSSVTDMVSSTSEHAGNSTQVSERPLRRSIEDSLGSRSLILEVLSHYPQSLVKWLSWRSGVPSKSLCNIQFNDIVIDFAIGIYQPTLGQWEWKIILIGDPHASYFSKNGTQTVELSDALERANTIKAAIQSNLGKLRTILPDVQAETPIIVVLGRRKDISETDKKKISLLRLSMPGVVLNSFDAILDSL